MARRPLGALQFISYVGRTPDSGVMDMTATILPFPIVRRRGFIAKQVAHASMMNPDSGLRYLQHQIEIQGDAMRRKGIDGDRIKRELRRMEVLIQAACGGTVQSDGVS
jgi:hypothetical protein